MYRTFLLLLFVCSSAWASGGPGFSAIPNPGALVFQATPVKHAATEPASARTAENLANAPLLFIENAGQIVDDAGNARPDILFTATARGAKVFVTANALHYVFTRVEYEKENTSEAMGVRDHERKIKSTSIERFTVSLKGANPKAALVKETGNSYYENYYLAHCPQGVTAHTFEKIRLKNVYPGVDWVLYSNGQGLKYDFDVSEARLTSQIKLQVTGATARLTEGGDLTLTSQLGQITEEKPVSFQAKRTVDTRFTPLEDNTFGFAFQNVDRNQAVTIDPAISWSTYYGGSANDRAESCTVDAANNLYVTGWTSSPNFPTKLALSAAIGGGPDAFVVAFSPTGVRNWATYYGGSQQDEAWECATDQSGGLYIVGKTKSPDYPITSIFQTGYGGGTYDGFIVKLTLTGTRTWATFIGGNGDDGMTSCTTDNLGNLVVIGYTNSLNFPTLAPFQSSYSGNTDITVSKFSTSGTCLWSTYFGGWNLDNANSCATDSNGDIFFTGRTFSSTYPPLSGRWGADGDILIAKFSSSGTKLWCFQHGGWARDVGEGCAVDSYGNVYVVGNTNSPDVPTKLAFQSSKSGPPSSFAGSEDGFILKISGAGVWLWGTYFGGVDFEIITSCSVDDNDNLVFVGGSASPTLHGVPTPITTRGWPLDIFLASFHQNGYLLSSVAYGRNEWELATSCKTISSGHAYLVGVTDSDDMPCVHAFNRFRSGYKDAFIMKIDLTCSPPAAPAINAAKTVICQGDSVLLNVPAGSSYLWSTGDTSRSISVKTAGSYSVQRITGRCTSGVSSVTVQVNPRPVATLTALGPTNFCPGDSVMLQASGGDSYLWNNGATTPTIIVKDNGTFSVRATKLGCMGPPSAYIVVTKKPDPLASIIASGPTTICRGTTLTLTANGGSGYLWSNGSATKAIVVRESGQYTVRAISAGCTGKPSAPVTIDVIPVPVVTVKPLGPTTFCTGEAVELVANGGSGYIWSSGETTQKITVAKAGIYSVRAINQLCSSTASPTVVVTVNPKPGKPYITRFGGDSLLASGNGAKYLWYRDNVLLPSSSMAKIGVKGKTGSYSVRVVANNCTSAVSNEFAITYLVNKTPFVSIWPNPSQGNLTISSTNSDLLAVRLYDILGRTAFSSKATNTTLSIDCHSLPPGTYILQVETTLGTATRKVVLE